MGAESSDVTGFISDCVQRLLSAGFDAGAFEMAKWAGVACLAALGLSAIAGFGVRVYKGASDIEPPVSENQFRWLLYVGALLIALPVVTKITTDNTTLDFESSDRSFAQQVCSEQLESFSQTAVIEGLDAKIENLSFELAQIRDEAVTVAPPTSGPPQPAEVKDGFDSQILGQAVSIFFRGHRQDDAQVIADILRKAGAGVNARESDLSETSRAQTAPRGANFLLSDTRAVNAPSAISDTLAKAGFDIAENVTVGSLSGTAVQILLY